MAKVKISEYSATPSANTDIDNIDINENCSPSGINNAIRALMSHLKNWQGGTSGDTLPVASGGTGSANTTTARSNLGAAASGANSDITSLTGLTTPLSVAQGGTGGANATTARTNLGLGSIATQASSSVSITGGSISGITDLAVADGGTGGSNATTARTNLGLVIGTDVQAYNANTVFSNTNTSFTSTNSFTGKQTFTGSATTISSKFNNALEAVTVSATAATGTIAYDVTTQSVLYYTSNASANWTVNLRGNGSNTLNSLMAAGESVTVVFLVTNGATAYYNNVVQVDGTTVTPKWQNGSAPTAGNASSIDAYSYTIVKTASATFTVFASLVQFK